MAPNSTTPSDASGSSSGSSDVKSQSKGKGKAVKSGNVKSQSKQKGGLFPGPEDPSLKEVLARKKKDAASMPPPRKRRAEPSLERMTVDKHMKASIHGVRHDDAVSRNWVSARPDLADFSLVYTGTGNGGLFGVRDRLCADRVQFVYVKVQDDRGVWRYVLVTWLGVEAPQRDREMAKTWARTLEEQAFTDPDVRIQVSRREDMTDEVVIGLLKAKVTDAALTERAPPRELPQIKRTRTGVMYGQAIKHQSSAGGGSTAIKHQSLGEGAGSSGEEGALPAGYRERLEAARARSLREMDRDKQSSKEQASK